MSARLSNIDLDMILKKNHVTKKGYIGTFPACEIPILVGLHATLSRASEDVIKYMRRRVGHRPTISISKKKRHFFITNTDLHDEPGTHWTAWMVEGDKVEFFDSFGRSPNNEQFPYEFTEFILGKKVSYSAFRVQKYTSKTCGYFCMYYIYFRSLGLDFAYIIKQLKNLKENDDIVISFFNSLIN